MHTAFSLKQLELLSKYHAHLWYDNKSFINWIMIQEWMQVFCIFNGIYFSIVYASIWAIRILMSRNTGNTI